MGGIGVGELDDHGRVGYDGGVEGDEEFEVEGFGCFVEGVEPAFELGPGAVPAAVVDGEGIDAGGFGELDVICVVVVGRLNGYQVVGEYTGAGEWLSSFKDG